MVIGLGGLGCPLLTYIASSGVGKIGIVDFDKVEISNLNRQTLFSPSDIGKFKVNQAKKAINKINKKINIIPFKKKLTSKNIKKIFSSFDIICDGTDNYNTRYLINDSCYMDWFKRKDKKIKEKNKKSIPDGLWEKCSSCKEILFKPELDKNLSVCRHCDFHFRMHYKNYLDLIIDSGSETRLFENIKSSNFLDFTARRNYDEQLKDAYAKGGNTDSIEIYSGAVKEKSVILGIMNFGILS